MNLKADAGAIAVDDDTSRVPDNESVNSETLNTPLPENKDELFGPAEIESLSLGPSLTGSPQENLELASHDSYYDLTEEEKEGPIDPHMMHQFSSLIHDKCMGVPPTMAVKLLWEDGIMSHIFDDNDGLPTIPLPQIGPVEVLEEAPKSPPCLDPFKQGSGRGVYLGVINFDLNITGSEMEQGTWSSALQKWYVRGYDLDRAIDSRDIHSLREVFGSRSANTVLRRGNTMVRFMKWFRDFRFSLCPFPISEFDIEAYLGHLTKIKAGASGFPGFIEALRFCEHVVGIQGAAAAVSIKAQKMVELTDMERPEKKQARVLTVREVETLERILLDEQVELTDRYAAGALLFCLYSRSRLSDLKKVRGYVKDIIEVNGTIPGYIEFRTRSRKTARLVSRQGISMPLVAPVWGLLSPP
eukprot:s448_g45.t1